MDRDARPSERAPSDARWLTGGLSMVVLLALLSSTPGAWSVAASETQGRVACGALAVPVVVVEVASEEPRLWRSPVEAGVRGVGRTTCAAPSLLREELLSLPPPAVV